jgi:DNA-binding NarL/FixJ family response regulator
MPDGITRWTVSVSKDTDIAVRSFLAQRGMKKSDLARFIEEAVKWPVLDQTMAEARSKFADMPPSELELLIDEAGAAVRMDHASYLLEMAAAGWSDGQIAEALDTSIDTIARTPPTEAMGHSTQCQRRFRSRHGGCAGGLSEAA